MAAPSTVNTIPVTIDTVLLLTSLANLAESKDDTVVMTMQSINSGHGYISALLFSLIH